MLCEIVFTVPKQVCYYPRNQWQSQEQCPVPPECNVESTPSPPHHVLNHRFPEMRNTTAKQCCLCSKQSQVEVATEFSVIFLSVTMEISREFVTKHVWRN